MKKNLNNIFLILAAIAVAGGLYWYFFTGSSSSSEAPLTVSGANSAAQAKFETLIGQLAPITFDLAILSDPRFTSLIDLTTPITPEPIGRTDPFAPIPGVSK